MTLKTHTITKKKETHNQTWEWEETSDARKAIQRLHEDIRKSIEDLDRNSDK